MALEGYRRADRDVEIERGGEATLAVELEALPTRGTLVVESATTGALVAVDGSERGAPPLRLALDPGRHDLAVSAPGHQPLEREIAISLGEVLRVQADLSSEESWLESPVLWTIVGVVVAGGVVGAVLAVTLSETEPLLQGDLGLVTGLVRAP